MIDLRAILARDSLPPQCLADPPGVIRQVFHLGKLRRLTVIADQKEPVAAPGDVPDYHAGTLDLKSNVGCVAVTGNILDRDLVAAVVLEGDDADRRIQPVSAWSDTAQVGERDRHADRAVAAHPQVADVVEEDDAGHAGLDRRGSHSSAPTSTSEPRGSLTTAERKSSC